MRPGFTPRWLLVEKIGHYIMQCGRQAAYPTRSAAERARACGSLEDSRASTAWRR